MTPTLSFVLCPTEFNRFSRSNRFVSQTHAIPDDPSVPGLRGWMARFRTAGGRWVIAVFQLASAHCDRNARSLVPDAAAPYATPEVGALRRMLESASPRG